jgi:membrane protease YdiL (CAAX protease family)
VAAAAEPGDVATRRWSFTWSVAGYLAGNVAAIVLVPLWAALFGSDGIVPILVGSIGLWAGFVGAPVLASRTQGTGDVAADFGVRLDGRDVGIGIVTGIGLQLVALPALYALIQLVTGPLDVAGAASDLADEASLPAAWLAFAVIVGVGAPLAEELFFRGLLLASFDARFGRVVAVVASSALFAATHFQVIQFPGLFVAALTWASLTVRSGRLGPAIVSHVAFNLTTVASLWLSR